MASQSLDEPLLFGAIISLAAIHVSNTTAPTARAAAEFYHGYCIRSLIEIGEVDKRIESGLALATTCLLRSYEILGGKWPFLLSLFLLLFFFCVYPGFTGCGTPAHDLLIDFEEDVDPNLHLQGAYSLASGGGLQSDHRCWTAGFWNYLREDITYSLFTEVNLKMDLNKTSVAIELSSDQAYLNSISLVLGKIINVTFGTTIHQDDWETLIASLQEWSTTLPERFRAFSKVPPGFSGKTIPSIWMVQDCHGKQHDQPTQPDSIGTKEKKRKQRSEAHQGT